MKLFYAPGACSLAPHIIAREAGLALDLDRVDLRAKRTSAGRDYREIAALGAVPALELDDGEVLTENAVVLQYLASMAPEARLAPSTHGMAHWRLLEMLNFIATELHKSFGQLFADPPAIWRQELIRRIGARLDILQRRLGAGPFLMGEMFTIADPYAFVILRWTGQFGIDLAGWPELKSYRERIAERPAVRQALREEGLPAA